MTGHSWGAGTEPQGACLSFQLRGCRYGSREQEESVSSSVPEFSVAGSMQSL